MLFFLLRNLKYFVFKEEKQPRMYCALSYALCNQQLYKMASTIFPIALNKRNRRRIAESSGITAVYRRLPQQSYGGHVSSKPTANCGKGELLSEANQSIWRSVSMKIITFISQ